jgi:hypothetical protein
MLHAAASAGPLLQRGLSPSGPAVAALAGEPALSGQPPRPGAAPRPAAALSAAAPAAPDHAHRGAGGARGPAPSGRRRRFRRASLRATWLLRSVRGAVRRRVPTFLQCRVPPGVTARSGPGSTLSPTAAPLAAPTSARLAPRGRHLLKHVFRSGNDAANGLQCPDPPNGGRSGRA